MEIHVLQFQNRINNIFPNKAQREMTEVVQFRQRATTPEHFVIKIQRFVLRTYVRTHANTRDDYDYRGAPS